MGRDMSRYEQNIVIDLEFTPVDKRSRTKRFRYEIIQIGAVRMSNDGEIVDTFSSYVSHEYAAGVSRQVRELTGITNGDLFNEDGLADVLSRFRKWVGNAKTRYIAWSDTDFKQLSVETDRKRIEFPEGSCRWLDLQKVYPKYMKVGNGRLMSLHAAADWYGVKVSEDQLHGALYDARVTAELMKYLITGDYKEQKESLASFMPQKSEAQQTTFNLGEKFSVLFELKASLETCDAVS